MACIHNKPKRLLVGLLQYATLKALMLNMEILDVSLLVNRKKFRARGGHDGALDAMQRLEEDGMGKLVLKKSKGSVKVFFLISFLYLINIISLN